MTVYEMALLVHLLLKYGCVVVTNQQEKDDAIDLARVVIEDAARMGNKENAAFDASEIPF